MGETEQSGTSGQVKAKYVFFLHSAFHRGCKGRWLIYQTYTVLSSCVNLRNHTNLPSASFALAYCK